MSRWHSKVKAPEMNGEEQPAPLQERFFVGPAGIPSVLRHRALGCSSYDRCLTLACARDWPNWTCRGCSRFVPVAEEEHRLIQLRGRSKPVAEPVATMAY